MTVTAREDTFAYRAAKFVRRHQGAVIAASLAVLALISGTITTSWEAHIARLERGRAERRFNDVRQVANSLLFDVHDAIRNLPGSTPARQLIVTKALGFLDSLARDAGDDRGLQRELAMAYERVGDVQGEAREGNVGDTNGALASYRKALSIRQNIARFDPDVRRELVPNFGKLSDLLWGAGDSAASLAYSRQGLEISHALAAAPDASRQDRIRLATNYLDYGYKQAVVAGDRIHGLENCRRSLGMIDQLIAADPSDRRLLRISGIGYDRTAEVIEADATAFGDALKMRRQALGIKTRLLHLEPANTDYRRLWAWSLSDLAALQVRTGDVAQAADNLKSAIGTFRQLTAQDPANTQFRKDYEMAQARLADARQALRPALRGSR